MDEARPRLIRFELTPSTGAPKVTRRRGVSPPWYWLLLGASLALGCGPGRPPADPDEVSSLRPYFEGATALLDGTFTLALQRQFAGVAPAPEQDPSTAERAAAAEGIVPVTIVTVMADSASDGRAATLRLAVKQRGAALTGRGLSPGASVLDVEAGTATHAQIRTWDAGLAGQRAVLYFGRYNQAGHLRLCWLLDADTPALRAQLGALHAPPKP